MKEQSQSKAQSDERTRRGERQHEKLLELRRTGWKRTHLSVQTVDAESLQLAQNRTLI